MTTITLKQFKNSAKRFHETHGSVLNLTYTQSLQQLSQIFFSKTFEEIQATLFKDEQHFTIIKYNNSYYIYEFKKNIAVYQTLDAVKLFFKESSYLFDSKYVFEVPYIGNLTISKLTKYLKKYGVFEPQKSIIIQLDNADKIFIDDRFSPYNLNGDWFESIENNQLAFEENESSDNPLQTCIWFAETNEEYHLYEYYITFEQLLNAKYIENNTWIVEQEGFSVLIKIYN